MATTEGPNSGGPVVKWGDEAMYAAAPLSLGADDPVEPHVKIITMTHNPLKVIAAAAQMYNGDPVMDPDDVPDSMAIDWFQKILANNYPAPLEYCDIHFLLQGVSRAFTHQIVRERTAVFVQESMRFAVKENVEYEVVMPPCYARLADDHPDRLKWMDHVKRTADFYNEQVNKGYPAEDVRNGLLIGTATQMHYKTNLRMLREHSGKRLCSQAQYEWKLVWREFIREILEYGPPKDFWQQRMIASIFKPVCYMTGKCEFPLPLGRYCVIRDRVDAHAEAGDPPNTWTDINPLAPLHPEAARRHA
jgi:flavin-dependent thymidylate synthase